MRFAILGISHETNTFSPVPADYASFESEGILRGREIVEEFSGSEATAEGFLQAARELGFEGVPLIHARTGPIGTITKDAFDRIVGEMIDSLRENGPWDAVLLANHGAAVSEEYPDVDGEVSRRVRDLVGPDLPVGIAVDMHANVSQEMVRQTTVATVYRSNPHLDARKRAWECAEIIFRTAKGEIKPVQWLEMPPMYINIVKQFTGEEPMKSLVADSLEAQEAPGIISTSVAEGYPYADVEEMGMSFLAIADGDLDLAREKAVWMADRAWGRRAEMHIHVPSVREALEMAGEHADANPDAGPVVLMDVGDNIGGGSSADSTHILEVAQRMGVRRFLQSLYDPDSVRMCVGAGVGGEVSIEVGAKTDDLHGRPVAVTGRVTRLSDGKYEDTRPTHGGYRFFDAGTSAVLETTDDHTLFLTSKRDGNTSREQMYSVGIWPERYRIVVAKGVVSPRPAYQPIASRIILVNTPGVTTADMTTFTYNRRRKPLYPFEMDAVYVP